MGKYWELNMGYQTFEIYDKNDRTSLYNGSSALVGAGFGRSRMIGERVIVDLSFNFTLTFGINKPQTLSEEFATELTNKYGYPTSNAEEGYRYIDEYALEMFPYESRARMARLNNFCLRLGVSGLLF